MLHIKNLSHTYSNGVQALNNINLTIPKGMFGLLGPNGAGKSSLMRTLATLQQPSEGEITFNQIDVINSPVAIRQLLGYLPQEFGVYPRGSCYDLLNHLAVLKGITDKKERRNAVESLLVKTNLYKFRHKKLTTFSGGMRQRFGIAQALLAKPQLIIVDEPTAGLDPEERNRFHNLLSEIGEEIVVILSTHIVDDVADLCPNMAVLAGGVIVTTGTPTTLTEHLTGKIWQRTIDKKLLPDFSLHYNVISSHLCAGQLKVKIYADSAPDNSFEEVTPRLEDVYFTVINQPQINIETNRQVIPSQQNGVS